MRDAHASDGAHLLNPRTTMSLLRGPMTRDEISRARAMGSGEAASTVAAPAG